MSDSSNTDAILRRVGGCGLFQMGLAVCVSLTYITCSVSTIFMAFGNYNPGWRCLDNNASTHVINYIRHDTATTLVNTDPIDAGGRWEWEEQQNGTTPNDFTVSCEIFPQCDNVEFLPGISTIATEWGLICDQVWTSSFVISLQMMGTTAGAFASGYFGDTFGRKITLYTSVLFHSAFCLLSILSSSVEMFAGIRFVLGLSCGMVFGVSPVYMAEFVTPKWRSAVISLPLWCFGCVVFSVCALVFKDWRQIHIFNGIFSAILILPALVCPESLRWLKVNDKNEKAAKAVVLIAKWNRVPNVPAISGSCRLATKGPRQKSLTSTIKSIAVLFRKKSLHWITILSFVIFLSNLIYFSTSFGLAVLPGDIYIINIIVYITELPANIVGWFVPNIVGRKRTGIGLHLVLSISIFAFLVFDFQTTAMVQSIGTLVSIIVARICCSAGFFLVVMCTSELYPTVIRSAAVGFVFLWSGIGAIVSPYTVIDKDILLGSFLALAVASLLCSGLFFFIPETLGKDLEDNFNSEIDSTGNKDDDDDEEEDDDGDDSKTMGLKL